MQPHCLFDFETQKYKNELHLMVFIQEIVYLG